VNDQTSDQLASLQRRLQSYVEGCRRLPGDFPALASGLQLGVDRLAVIGERTPIEPPTNGEAA
jgi:hypothetical protein